MNATKNLKTVDLDLGNEEMMNEGLLKPEKIPLDNSRDS
jgi:hypothetical protein